MEEDQKTLSAAQLEEFYHDLFVSDQVADFDALILQRPGISIGNGGEVVDLGGGVGFFAERVARDLNLKTRVVDLDPVSVARCVARGVEARVGDIVAVIPNGRERVVCFNLILHHLVGEDSAATAALQLGALATWANSDALVFVNEYLYESYVPGFSSWLIYQVTSSALLSSIASLAGRIFPSLRANTLGVGVRFRCDAGWRKVFAAADLQVLSVRYGADEEVTIPLRVLLIKKIRRTSYLLAGRAAV